MRRYWIYAENSSALFRIPAGFRPGVLFLGHGGTAAVVTVS
ncbi:hypothetical protein [Streptomyces sp. NPDC054786]